MKNVIRLIIVLCIMLSITLMPGCGKNENEVQGAGSEPAAAKTVFEQKTDQSVGIGEPTPAQTDQAGAADLYPSVQETKKDLSAEDIAAAPQTAGSSMVTEITSVTQKIIEDIIIENQGYSEDKKGPVKFSHLKHNKDYKVSCAQCHHMYKNGENQWKEGDKVEKCAVCHDPLTDKERAVKLQNAFHKNCKDCHSEVNKEGKEAPSTKCTGCHS